MNKIQNKIYDYHEGLRDIETVKSNQAKMKAMADKYGEIYFDRRNKCLIEFDMGYQQTIDECWEFFGMDGNFSDDYGPEMSGDN